MNNAPSRVPAVGLLVAALMFAAATTVASDRRTIEEIEIGEFVDETQKQSPDQDLMDLVWWMPIEFWLASAAAEPRSSPEDLEELETVLAPYTIIGIISGDIGPFGGVTWRDRATVRELVALEDGSGGQYRPLSDEKISGDARNLISMMGPILSSTVGPMGENLHLFCFPGADENGRRVADPAAVGSFTVRVGEETYRWDLPLASVLQALKCPVDDKPMKGNWKYCPFHGKKLVARD